MDVKVEADALPRTQPPDWSGTCCGHLAIGLRLAYPLHCSSSRAVPGAMCTFSSHASLNALQFHSDRLTLTLSSSTTYQSLTRAAQPHLSKCLPSPAWGQSRGGLLKGPLDLRPRLITWAPSPFQSFSARLAPYLLWSP